MGLDVKLLRKPLPAGIADMSWEDNARFFDENTLYESGITHNLGKMAKEAGVYQHLWRPEELGISQAISLVGALGRALGDLHARQDYYRQFNPENGWGAFEDLVRFISTYLQAAIDHPDAYVYVSR